MTDNARNIAALMAPGGDRPQTWAEWYSKPVGYEAYIEGFGVVRVEVSDTEENEWGETQWYTLIFSTQSCDPVRYYRIRGDYGSFGDYDPDPFDGAFLEEVTPNVQTVHSWRPV